MVIPSNTLCAMARGVPAHSVMTRARRRGQAGVGGQCRSRHARRQAVEVNLIEQPFRGRLTTRTSCPTSGRAGKASVSYLPQPPASPEPSRQTALLRPRPGHLRSPNSRRRPGHPRERASPTAAAVQASTCSALLRSDSIAASQGRPIRGAKGRPPRALAR
jgi:hypothetical protein